MKPFEIFVLASILGNIYSWPCLAAEITGTPPKTPASMGMFVGAANPWGFQHSVGGFEGAQGFQPTLVTPTIPHLDFNLQTQPTGAEQVTPRASNLPSAPLNLIIDPLQGVRTRIAPEQFRDMLVESQHRPAPTHEGAGPVLDQDAGGTQDSGPQVPDLGSRALQGELRYVLTSNAASLHAAAHGNLTTMHWAVGAPFTGASAEIPHRESFVADVAISQPAASQIKVWDYAQSGPLRLTIGGEQGLTLEVRSFEHMSEQSKAGLNQEVGYFILDPSPAGFGKFKGLRERQFEEVVLGPDSPSRFNWPKGVTASVKISREKDSIRIEVLSGGPVRIESASVEQEARKASKVKLQTKKFVSPDGNGAWVTVTEPSKKKNEDAVVVDVVRRIILVADGMGGHAAGDVAAAIAKRVILAELRKRITEETSPNKAKRILQEALVKANTAILQHTEDHAETKGMGTTVAVGVVVKNTLVTASVGDSDISVRRMGGKLQKLSKDDTPVAHMRERVLLALKESGADMARIRRAGKISVEDITKARRRLMRLYFEDQIGMYEDDPVMNEARKRRKENRKEVHLEAYETHPDRHIVSHSLGSIAFEGFGISKGNLRQTRIKPGDIVIASTDGFGDNVPEKQERDIASEADTPKELVHAMGNTAKQISLEPGTDVEKLYSKRDDITVAALRIP